MAAARKGEVAKATAKDIIIKAFGDMYLGEMDKKLYVAVDDGGEKIQLALSMTMPKVGFGDIVDEVNVAAEPASAATPTTPVTDKDKETIAELMKRLGI